MRSFIRRWGSFVFRAELDSIKGAFCESFACYSAWFCLVFPASEDVVINHWEDDATYWSSFPALALLIMSAWLCVMWLVCLAVCCGKHSSETCHLSRACYYHFPLTCERVGDWWLFQTGRCAAWPHSAGFPLFLISRHRSVPGLFTLLSHLSFFLSHLSCPWYLRARTRCIHQLSLRQFHNQGRKIHLVSLIRVSSVIKANVSHPHPPVCTLLCHIVFFFV